MEGTKLEYKRACLIIDLENCAINKNEYDPPYMEPKDLVDALRAEGYSPIIRWAFGDLLDSRLFNRVTADALMRGNILACHANRPHGKASSDQFVALAAAEVARHTDCDAVVIAAGDVDFVRALQSIQSEFKEAIILSRIDKLSTELSRASADKVITYCPSPPPVELAGMPRARVDLAAFLKSASSKHASDLWEGVDSSDQTAFLNMLAMFRKLSGQQEERRKFCTVGYVREAILRLGENGSAPEWLAAHDREGVDRILNKMTRNGVLTEHLQFNGSGDKAHVRVNEDHACLRFLAQKLGAGPASANDAHTGRS